MSTFNFKDDLCIDNNKYLKWLNNNNTKTNIIGLNSSGNLNLNSNNTGDIYINSSNTSSNTFLNVDNTNPIYLSSKVNVGLSSGNYNSNLTLSQNSWIGLNNNTGYLALSASDSLNSSTGSRIILNGNLSSVSTANISFYSGNNTSGNISFFSGKDSLVLQILNTGLVNFTPNGSTVRLSVSDSITSINNPLIISSTAESNSSTTGAVQISGGIGIKGNTYIDGTLSINSVSGNLNFNNSTASTSYSTGTIFISGGLGIECSTAASSPTAGGGLSVAGGLALGQNAMIAGNVTVYSTIASISSQTGSIISYGGLGINGQFNLRSDTTSQIRLVPVTNNNETSIFFGAQNNYTLTNSWVIGQNINLIGSNIFSINNSSSSFISFDGNTNFINLNKNVYINTTTNATSTTSGGTLTTSGGAAIAKKLYVGEALNVTGNIDFTGNLFQNGSTYVAQSQWTGTGNSIYYGTSGNVNVGIGTTNPSYTLDVSGNLRINNTTISTNATTAGIVSIGGISINCTSDSSSFTSGGGLTTNGGIAIAKSLALGNNLNLSGVSTQFSGSFSAANNVSVASDITGLIFTSANIRSFTALICVQILKTGGNLFAHYTVEGIQNDSGWSIFDSNIGDTTGISFSITSTGQIQYTSTSLTGFTKSTLNYNATAFSISGFYFPNN